MTQSEFEESVGTPAGGAQATWDFCDKNRDGTACVMRQTFPNGSVFYILLDNRPFGR